MLREGLGAGITERGFEILGREIRNEFRALPFQDKINLISDDLKTHFWHEDGFVIANSFGSYLFLHTQADLPPFPGRVLLLSPIVGGFNNVDSGVVFSPPRPDKLMTLAEQCRYPKPVQCEIHVGSVDWQSDPETVSKFGGLTGIPVTIAPGKGHMLGKDYVAGVLDVFLKALP